MNNYSDFLQVPELPSLSPWSEVNDALGDDVAQWSPVESQTFGGDAFEAATARTATSADTSQEPARRSVKMKRREHKKSRAGCFHCKSRKIKVRAVG